MTDKLTAPTPPASLAAVDWLQVARDYEQYALKGPWPGIQTPHYALSGAFKAMGAEIESLRAALAALAAPPTPRGEVEWDLRNALNDSETLMNGDVVITAEHAAQLNADVDAWEADDFHASDIAAGVLMGEQAWDELVNVDDRTSPEEYPDMCLITRDELIEFVRRAQSTAALSTPRAEIGDDARAREPYGRESTLRPGFYEDDME
jgi:hypothetical protein